MKTKRKFTIKKRLITWTIGFRMDHLNWIAARFYVIVIDGKKTVLLLN